MTDETATPAEENAGAGDGPTLTDALRERGFSHKRCTRRGIPPDVHDVRPLRRSHLLAFSGNSDECWLWLHDGCQWDDPEAGVEDELAVDDEIEIQDDEDVVDEAAE